MVRSSDYKVLLLNRNGRVAGFSLLFVPLAQSFGLLEYMAISAEYRNQGLGAEIFRRTVQSMMPLSTPILLEVDSDREKCADCDLRKRRQQFYRRLGCLRIAQLHYILPLPGGGPPPEMDLMIYSTATLRTIAKPELERWLKAIYRDVYHCPPDDPRIKEMLQDVSDPVHLE